MDTIKESRSNALVLVVIVALLLTVVFVCGTIIGVVFVGQSRRINLIASESNGATEPLPGKDIEDLVSNHENEQDSKIETQDNNSLGTITQDVTNAGAAGQDVTVEEVNQGTQEDTVQQDTTQEAKVQETKVQEDVIPDTTVEEKKPKETTLHTRLRTVGDPVGDWYRSSKLQLKSVKVTIRNVGEVTANDISIYAVIPGGRKLKLEGPATLERNKKALYELYGLKEDVFSYNETIRAEISCSNCWK